MTTFSPKNIIFNQNLEIISLMEMAGQLDEFMLFFKGIKMYLLKKNQKSFYFLDVFIL